MAALAFVMLLALVMSACTAQTSGGWQILGPDDGSIVLSMISDGQVPQLVYAGTSMGQVYRTRTDSRTAAAGKGLPASSAVPSLVAEPGKGGVVFAGTSSGVYVTSDYGDTWHARGTGLPHGDTVQSFAFVPSDVTTLYAGTQEHGAYLSRDSGFTWSPLNDGLPVRANVYALAYDAGTNTMFAALSGGAGIFAMNSGGTTWSARSVGLPTGSEVFALLPMAAHGALSARLYAGTSKGAYTSADGGSTWTPSGLDSSRVLSLAGDPTTPGALYAGTDTDLARGVDGQAWRQVAPGIQHPVAAIAVRQTAPGHVVVFVGAQNILRYPPNLPPSGGTNTVFTVVILLGLIALLFYFGRRTLRMLGGSALAQSGRDASHAETSGSTDTTRSNSTSHEVPQSDGSSRGAHNGHDPLHRL